MNILVAGASGYIGQQLVPRLVQAGHSVYCMVRDPKRIKNFFPRDVTLVAADALKPQTLAAALAGIEVAYYLIHSMNEGEKGFEQRDVEAASNFAKAAKAAGVQRLVYLGGLGKSGAQLSAHLKSRHHTGEILRQFGPPTTELRAAIIVGNGSISFEMIRYLSERLPAMICPRWVTTRVQPIAIDDILAYLVATLDSPRSIGQIIEIGGTGVETYYSMMVIYARVRGLRRWLLRVPVLTPRLSSYWLDLVTPIPAAISRPLIEGLRSEVIVRDDKAKEIFPDIKPVNYEQAVRRAFDRIDPAAAESAVVHSAQSDRGHRLIRRDGLILDISHRLVKAPVSTLFSFVQGIGGKRGWLYANQLWQIRGAIDSLFGGVGLRRGRKNPDQLSTGDTLDFWTVQEVTENSRILLRAEMKVPGRAWLEFTFSPIDAETTHFYCVAVFEPLGLAGELYWDLLYPIHWMIFRGLTSKIKSASESQAASALVIAETSQYHAKS